MVPLFVSDRGPSEGPPWQLVSIPPSCAWGGWLPVPVFILPGRPALPFPAPY
jgi:hypothetical protein